MGVNGVCGLMEYAVILCTAGGAQQQESSRSAGELRLREAAADSALPVHTGAFMNTGAPCEAVLQLKRLFCLFRWNTVKEAL